MLKPLNLATLLLLIASGVSVLPISLPGMVQSVQAQANETQKAEADRLLEQGIQQLETSQFREALQSWEAALKIYREIGDRNGEARSLNNLGSAYDFLGQYPKAIEYYQQSLAIFKDIGDRNGEADSLMGLGNAYYSLGQYPKAIEYYQQSLAIFKDIGDREAEGINLSNLGASYEAQNQPGLAIVFYKQSVIVREGIRQDLRVLEKELQQSYTETVAGTYRRLADLLLSQDRIFEAQQVLELLKLQEEIRLYRTWCAS
jgi:tetratricopeptide (TPR) repeat protein